MGPASALEFSELVEGALRAVVEVGEPSDAIPVEVARVGRITKMPRHSAAQENTGRNVLTGMPRRYLNGSISFR